MPIEWLVAWGAGKAIGALVKPVLEDVAKDFSKNKTKAWLRRAAKLIPHDEFLKAYGKALKELVEIIDEELRNAGVNAAQTEAWAQDIQQLIRTDALREALPQAFTASNGALDALTLQSGWQRLPEASPLPPDFDWDFVAKSFNRKLRKLREEDADWRAILQTQAAVETADATKRLAHLPPEFNLDGYRESLLEYHGHLKLELLDSAGAYHRVKLWSVFVAQTVRDCAGYVPQYLEIPKEVQAQLRAQGEWEGDFDRLSEELLNERRARYQDQSPRSVWEVVNEDRYGNLVILGDPGAGKSTLLKAVALEWTRIENRDERHAAKLPLLIELNAYHQWPCASGKSFVRYLQDAQTVHRLDQFRLDERLRQRDGAVLLLDGLDEIFDLPQRKAVLNDIHRFSNEYPQTRIIVTSRVIGYDQRQLADAGFRHFMLQDLDEAQINEFLTNWYVTFVSDSRERTAKQDRLRRAIAESRPIRELAENPLLLTMMAILNFHQELPRNRVKLYERATEVLLHQWDFERLGLGGVIEYPEKAEMLRRLADHMQNAPEGLRGNIIDGDTLRRIFREYLKDELELPNAYEAANKLIDDLRRRNFILCHLGADRYAFVHRTMLEYFCAAALVRRALTQPSSLDFLRDEVFAKHWHDEKWHEVLRLIAGMEAQVPVQHVAALIDFLLLQQDSNYEFHNVFLAAHCCVEVSNSKALGHSRTDSCDALLQMVSFDYPNSMTMEEEFEKRPELCTKAIHSLVNPMLFDEAHEWLIEHATKDGDWVVRKTVVRELARGWRQDADTLLILKTLVTQDENCDVRRAAVQELARGWKDNADTLLILKFSATQDDDGFVRSAAVEELARGWKDDPETLMWLKTRATQDGDRDVRIAVVQELARGWKDDSETLPWLKARATQDDDSDVRDVIVDELVQGWKGDAVMLPWFKARATEDENKQVRRTAVEELARGWKNHADTLPILKVCAQRDDSPKASDPDSENGSSVRDTALELLAELWPEHHDTLPFLRERAASDITPWVCKKAQRLADEVEEKRKRTALH